MWITLAPPSDMGVDFTQTHHGSKAESPITLCEPHVHRLGFHSGRKVGYKKNKFSIPCESLWVFHRWALLPRRLYSDDRSAWSEVSKEDLNAHTGWCKSRHPFGYLSPKPCRTLKISCSTLNGTWKWTGSQCKFLMRCVSTDQPLVAISRTNCS